MHACHRSVSIQRGSLVVAAALMAALLAGCGVEGRSNPFAPSVGAAEQTGTLAAVAKSSKPKHGHGNQGNSLRTGTSSGSISGGVTSGPFGDPGTENPAVPFVTE
jgi:hypothetical protein